MFLMTDAQVANEQFLVLINDLLASGEVADLFPDDEMENIIAGVRNEVNTITYIFTFLIPTNKMKIGEFNTKMLFVTLI